jgi:hypothetical protein
MYNLIWCGLSCSSTMCCPAVWLAWHKNAGDNKAGDSTGSDAAFPAA